MGVLPTLALPLPPLCRGGGGGEGMRWCQCQGWCSAAKCMHALGGRGASEDVEFDGMVKEGQHVEGGWHCQHVERTSVLKGAMQYEAQCDGQGKVLRRQEGKEGWHIEGGRCIEGGRHVEGSEGVMEHKEGKKGTMRWCQMEKAWGGARGRGCQKHVWKSPWVTEHQGDCRLGNKTDIQWGESIVLTCRWGNKTKELVRPSTGLYRQLDNRALRRVVQTQSWNHRTQNNGNRLWSVALTQCKLTEHRTMDVASEALP